MIAVLWSSLFYQLLVPLEARKSNLHFQSICPFLFIHFIVCTCVCTRICTHMHVVYVHICVQVLPMCVHSVQRGYWVPCSIILWFIPLRQCLLLNLKIGCLSTNLRDPIVSVPACGVCSHTHI